ncbi:MAG: hypothetical protein ACJ8F7_03620 [Gemmataceae bacterium]
MRKFLFFLALVAVCVIALGVYMDWFQFTKSDNKGSGKIDVGLTIDENKIKEDAEKAKEKIHDAKSAPAKEGRTSP